LVNGDEQIFLFKRPSHSFHSLIVRQLLIWHELEPFDQEAG